MTQRNENNNSCFIEWFDKSRNKKSKPKTWKIIWFNAGYCRATLTVTEIHFDTFDRDTAGE